MGVGGCEKKGVIQGGDGVGGRWREREKDDGDWTWPPRGDQSPLVQH